MNGTEQKYANWDMSVVIHLGVGWFGSWPKHVDIFCNPCEENECG